MKLVGMEGMTDQEIRLELQRGARFVVYQYCISILVMTFKRPSNICFVRAGESRVTKGLPFVLLSLVLGWWGIPWGPIWTISTTVTNLSGGRDVTTEVLASTMRAPQPAGAV